MRAGEAYLDIVWRMFKKNRLAHFALYMVGVLFLLAIFAPLIASDQPFIFKEDGKTLFPWFVMLFNPDGIVDFIFNMALLSFFPCLVVGIVLWRRWRNREVPGRTRVLRLAGIFALALVAANVCFAFFKPDNVYFARNFKQNPAAGTFTFIPMGPTEQDLDSSFKGPMYRKEKGDFHLLGTDSLGRDVLVRMLYGARISLTVGFISVSLYMTIGIIIGALAGYFGGWIDLLISRVIEIMMMFPTFFLILTLVGLIGPSLWIIMFVIGITGWPTTARLIRGEFLKQRQIDYVTAARALGSSNIRIVFKQILPNALAPVFVAAPFGIAGAIVTEAGLSVLGFGVRPPTPTWGQLLNLGRENYHMWWLVVFPSIAIFISVTVYNLVGSALRDATDPRLRV
jgi:peptide/nickel transport system permease protein